jgi:hypothetical protein
VTGSEPASGAGDVTDAHPLHPFTPSPPMPFARRPTQNEMFMVRTGRLTHGRSCAGKHKHSEAKAQRLARRRSEETGVVIAAYACLWCDGWHLGHPHRYR